VNLSDVASLAEKWTPDEIVAWSIEQFPGAITVACSFEDLVLVDIVRRHAPRTPVIFLDTEGHFPETYEFVNRIEKD
jgi:phosphoadenosine phosphosulfate reductase